MSLDKAKKEKYVQILKEELVPALGCTEPIAIAYTAANLRKIMGGVPDEILIESSGNIIKNAKSVIVPNTGGMKGMEASALIGLIGGNAGQDTYHCHTSSFGARHLSGRGNPYCHQEKEQTCRTDHRRPVYIRC